MRVTIKTVAREAGVSIGTVSLVINGSNLVKAETRAKVEETIKRLGYIPNHNAQSLITKRTNVIGLIRMDEENNTGTGYDESPSYFFSESLWPLATALAEKGYATLLDRHAMGDPNLPGMVRMRLVDGIILVGGLVTDEFISSIRDANVPAVLLGNQSPLLDSVDTDTRDAEKQATEYLISLGHRRILFLGGPVSSQTTERRIAGFTEAVDEAHLEIDSDCFVRLADSYSGLSGEKAFASFMEEEKNGVTGVICASDSLASGVFQWCRTHGKSCPGDISVIGYDGSFLSRYSVPKLTSVSIDMVRLAAEAADMLTRRIANPGLPVYGSVRQASLLLQDSARKID